MPTLPKGMLEPLMPTLPKGMLGQHFWLEHDLDPIFRPIYAAALIVSNRVSIPTLSRFFFRVIAGTV